MVMNGVNLYSGPTTVNAGGLYVNGSSAVLGVRPERRHPRRHRHGRRRDRDRRHRTPGFFGTGLLSTGALALVSTLEIDVNGSGNGQFDQPRCTCTLYDGRPLDLEATVPTTTGQSFRLIYNDGSVDGVTGQFAGLANMAIIPLNGRQYQIRYNGGDGNDVTLMDVTQPPPNTPPTITDVGDQQTVAGIAAGPVGFHSPGHCALHRGREPDRDRDVVEPAARAEREHPDRRQRARTGRSHPVARPLVPAPRRSP